MSDVVGKTFIGDVYLRPLGRGVCLGEDMVYFEDWLAEALGVNPSTGGGETVRLRITVERLDPAAMSGD